MRDAEAARIKRRAKALRPNPVAMLDRVTFREAAARAIAVYSRQRKLLDALFWSRVVALFEAEMDPALPVKLAKIAAAVDKWRRNGRFPGDAQLAVEEIAEILFPVPPNV